MATTASRARDYDRAASLTDDKPLAKGGVKPASTPGRKTTAKQLAAKPAAALPSKKGC